MSIQYKSQTKIIFRIAAKEMSLFFASPTAYVFLTVFALVSLFCFFWVESFFSRNIADVRPLFEWMPILLIFLCATLTMRLWSEEKRTGTLEFLVTQQTPLWYFVIGKYLACLLLLLIALLITLPIPLTLSFLLKLDWGVVLAGYLATLMLGAFYLSLGLFVSAQSSNQIISLIIAVILGALFYLIGAPSITGLFSYEVAEGLRQLGTGARFESILRGVIDLRDLFYYFSLSIVFLILNTLMIERQRWSNQGFSALHRRYYLFIFLFLVNVLLPNLWLAQFSSIRLDVTRNDQFTLAPMTKNTLKQLAEPLLIRGYFSEKTHPFLAPLIPQMIDLIKEYEIASEGRLRVEFITPSSNPELEREANEKYGIKSFPFQITDRYQSAIISAYFDILVEYGSEFKVLNFNDLIEVIQTPSGDVSVTLRNPEYDLTQAIKSVVSSYQAGGNLFDSITSPLQFKGFISASQKLPQELAEFVPTMQEVLQEMQRTSNDKLSYTIIDPDTDQRLTQAIQQQYGFRPMAADLFSDQQFYFNILLQQGDTAVAVPVDDLSKAGFQRNLRASIKRFAKGLNKTIGFVAPPTQFAQFGIQVPRFGALKSFIGAGRNIIDEDLNDGLVNAEVDLLFLAAPFQLSELAQFAVDQFLMRGGAVIVLTSPYSISVDQNSMMQMQPYESGLMTWLSHHGIEIKPSLVMDPISVPYPVPVQKDLGGFTIQEIQMVEYPYFIDVRQNGFKSIIGRDIGQVTFPWGVPIELDSTHTATLSKQIFMQSSAQSWLTDDLQVMPKVNPNNGTVSAYSPTGRIEPRQLAVALKGRFQSFFKDKESPLMINAQGEKRLQSEAESESVQDFSHLSRVIENSPESAQIIVFSSNDFVRDQVLNLLSAAFQRQYINSLQLLTNTIDWVFEDQEGLMSIRTKSKLNQTLPIMNRQEQLTFEYFNYGIAIFLVILIALYERIRRKQKNNKLSRHFGGDGVC